MPRVGMIHVTLQGSFGTTAKVFLAHDKGHAAAIGEAIKLLSTKLPKAVKLDHEMHARQDFPKDGFQLKGKGEADE